MVAVGDTNVPFGLMWGWHVLSPSAAAGGDGIFGDGVAYTDKEWTKIVVLMTDGQNENTPSGNGDESYYSGIGYIWQNRVGVGAGSTKSQRTTAVDDRLATLCSNMKAAPYNIVIYTVRVEVTTGTSTVLSNCATGSWALRLGHPQAITNGVRAFPAGCQPSRADKRSSRLASCYRRKSPSAMEATPLTWTPKSGARSALTFACTFPPAKRTIPNTAGCVE